MEIKLTLSAWATGYHYYYQHLVLQGPQHQLNSHFSHLTGAAQCKRCKFTHQSQQEKVSQPLSLCCIIKNKTHKSCWPMVLARESREIHCDGFQYNLITFWNMVTGTSDLYNIPLKCTRGSKIYRTKSEVSLMFAFSGKHRLVNIPFNSGFSGAMTELWWIMTE